MPTTLADYDGPTGLCLTDTLLPCGNHTKSKSDGLCFGWFCGKQQATSSGQSHLYRSCVPIFSPALAPGEIRNGDPGKRQEEGKALGCSVGSKFFFAPLKSVVRAMNDSQPQV